MCVYMFWYLLTYTHTVYTYMYIYTDHISCLYVVRAYTHICINIYMRAIKDWAVSKLRWIYVAGYDSHTYFVFLLPSPMNTIGLNSTEKPSAPGDPLPTRTTAFSLPSISERENYSSETTPPLSPDSTSTEESRNSLDNANSHDVKGWHRSVNWNEFGSTRLFEFESYQNSFSLNSMCSFYVWCYSSVQSVGRLGVHAILTDQSNECILARRGGRGAPTSHVGG